MSAFSSLIAYGSDSDNEEAQFQSSNEVSHPVENNTDKPVTTDQHVNQSSESSRLADTSHTAAIDPSTNPTTQSQDSSVILDVDRIPNKATKRSSDQISSPLQHEPTTHSTSQNKQPRVDLMDAAPKIMSNPIMLTTNKPKIKYSFSSVSQPVTQPTNQSINQSTSQSVNQSINQRHSGVDPRLSSQFESLGQSDIIDIKQTITPLSIPSAAAASTSSKPAIKSSLKLYNPATGREEVVNTVSSKHRSKHQVNSLIDQAARVRDDVDAARASGAANRAQTRAKYGW